jgi:hypothetical protein
MPFGEALERFAQTDPKEVKDMREAQEGASSGPTPLPEVMGHQIGEDAGNVCLNDLWEAAGKPEQLRATEWHRQKRTQALEAALIERIMVLNHKSEKSAKGSVYYVAGRGRASRTYAHPVLALAYAEDLLPALGVQVREIFLRYRANDISLANDILDRIAAQVQEDEQRIFTRDEIIEHNKLIAAHGKEAGCSLRWEYAELHNSGYRGLYNGLDENGIHKLKGLTKSQKILDHMTVAESAANLFRVTQANLAMETRKPKTPEEAFDIQTEAGLETRGLMGRVGGVMPEDMPVPDSVKEAKKRLAANKPLVGKGRKDD